MKYLIEVGILRGFFWPLSSHFVNFSKFHFSDIFISLKYMMIFIFNYLKKLYNLRLANSRY